MHYEEGLRLLDQTLALDLPNDISNVIPDDCDKEIIKVHKTRINLSRTRQQVVFRIHELKSNLQSETSPTTPSAPPSYEESEKNSLENALNKDLNSPTATTGKIKYYPRCAISRNFCYKNNELINLLS